MENASKALIIAGSVLIAILLIALGMKIFGEAAPATNELGQTMQTTEATMFNNKFLPYLGKTLNKTQVISFLNTVIASNATNDKKITVYFYTSSNTIDTIINEKLVNYNDSSKFIIKLHGAAKAYDAEGYIRNLNIIPQS